MYATIGECYAEIEQLEPWLEPAVPVVEAAIIADGLPLEDLSVVQEHLTDLLGVGVFGTVEARCKSSIFSSMSWLADDDIERYRLLVLPDTLRVSQALAARAAPLPAGRRGNCGRA